MEQKKLLRLDEVTLMRTILAFLIVFMHSFTCYQGSWAKPEGYVDIPVYKWIARTSFAFTLEAFVFISGYLVAFQSIGLKRVVSLKSLVINKLKRLLLPSVLFSCFYFFFFYEYNGLGHFFYSIINGCGHMWFLPMLFWCFIGGWLLEQIKVKDRWKLVFLACLNLFWPISLPLRMTEASNFMFYFYLGYVVFKHFSHIKGTITRKHLCLLWTLFIVVFIVFRPLKEMLVIGDQDSNISKLLTMSGRSACQLFYAVIGTLSFYLTVIWYTEHHKIQPFTVKLASCCFGIYLFQQFVLKGLYYKTSFAEIVGPYWLPWLGFLIAAPLSFFLSTLLLKSKTGRFLIG